MKKIILVLISICSISSLLAINPLTAKALNANLVNNASLENSLNNLPIGWSKNKTGKSTSTFTYNNFGHTGSKSATISIGNYSRGKAGWMPTVVSIASNTKYTFSDWFQSNTTSYINAVYTTTANRTVQKVLGSVAASSIWKSQTFEFITPANVKSVVIYHYIQSNGLLTIDDFSLSAAQIVIPDAPLAPIINVSLNSTNVLASIAPSTCTIGTSQYQIRSRVNDGTWGAWTTWSTKLTATQVASQGVKYGYQAQARCYSSTNQISSISTGLESSIIKPINVPSAPAVLANTNGTITTWSWTAVVCAANTTAQYQYNQTISSGYDSGWITTTNLSTAFSTSTENQTYTVKVQALCANSFASSAWGATGQASYFRPGATTQTNLIINDSVEQSVNNLPTNWANDSWKVNTGTNSYENTGRTGTHSLKTTITSYSAGDAYWYFDPVAVTPGKTYSFSDYYKSNVDTEIDIMVNFSNGTSLYYYLGMAASSPNDWSKFTGEFTMPANAVSVVIYQALAQVGYLQTDDYSLSEYNPQKFNRSLLSINFDDGWSSVYQNALPILNSYGFKSTQYLLTSMFNDSSHMNVAMIQDLQAQGHEIGSHSISHPHLTTLSASELINELTSSKATLQQYFGVSGVANNFASPYGEYNTTVINEIQKYYRSHRSTDVGFNSKDSFNVYNIKVQNIISTTTTSELQSWVNEAVATNTWLVLVYHEIGSTYDGTKFTTSTSNFNAQMNIIKQSGITVETNDQALDEIMAQL